jgi:hypothetical protein
VSATRTAKRSDLGHGFLLTGRDGISRDIEDSGSRGSIILVYLTGCGDLSG